jgi:hypothetical protein
VLTPAVALNGKLYVIGGFVEGWTLSEKVLAFSQQSSASLNFARADLVPPHFLRAIYRDRDWGAIMRQVIYCASLIAIWLCSTATVICVLSFGGLGLVLSAGACFAFFVSTAALAEEFVEWRRHTEPSPVKRLLLPPIY